MIFVRRNEALIPPELLRRAEAAQEELETITDPDKRREFIKSKAAIWREFGQYLARMSYGKCWYSESPDPQSFFDVDHFRPKLEAIRSDKEIDRPGYEWLAFSWENCRYAANCSNRRIENLDTGEVEGKGSWFPLLPGSARATWDNRCVDDERPILLDPVSPEDVALIDVTADGYIVADQFAVGSAKHRVARSCELYGLNLPRLRAARLRTMRDIHRLVRALVKDLNAAEREGVGDEVADGLSIPDLKNLLRDKTRTGSPYSRAARAALIHLGVPQLCAAPEDDAYDASDAA